MKAIAATAVLVASLALTACGNDCPQPKSLGAVEPVAMTVPMPAPVPPRPAPAPRPAAPRYAPAPKPAQQAPRQVPRQQAPRPYVRPPASVTRPRLARPMTTREIYVQHRVDHTPLLYLMLLNGSFSQPTPERCEQ